MSETDVVDKSESSSIDDGNQPSTSGPDWKKIVRSEFMRLRTLKRQKHTEQVKVRCYAFIP